MIASKEQLLALSEALRQHSGLELSTIATYAVNDGKLFKRWAAGGGATLRTAEAMLRWFSANWPEDLEWPVGVPRPTKSSTKGRAA